MNASFVTPRTSILSKVASTIAWRPASEVLAQVRQQRRPIALPIDARLCQNLTPLGGRVSGRRGASSSSPGPHLLSLRVGSVGGVAWHARAVPVSPSRRGVRAYSEGARPGWRPRQARRHPGGRPVDIPAGPSDAATRPGSADRASDEMPQRGLCRARATSMGDPPLEPTRIQCHSRQQDDSE